MTSVVVTNPTYVTKYFCEIESRLINTKASLSKNLEARSHEITNVYITYDYKYTESEISLDLLIILSVMNFEIIKSF